LLELLLAKLVKVLLTEVGDFEHRLQLWLQLYVFLLLFFFLLLLVLLLALKHFLLVFFMDNVVIHHLLLLLHKVGILLGSQLVLLVMEGLPSGLLLGCCLLLAG